MNKKITYSIIGSIIGMVLGFIFGAMVGLGESNQYKKSQRDTATPILLYGGAMIGAISCCIIGYRMGKTLSIEEAIGITDCYDNYYKKGRFWTGITKWTDPRDGKPYEIATRRIYQKVIQSSLNGKPIMTHDAGSASQVSIDRCQREARNFVFSKIKEAYDADPSVSVMGLF